MSLSHRLAGVFLSLYKNLNKTGVLDFKFTQSAFVSSYFAYKKYFADPNAKLIKNHPELFSNGHILDIGANIGYTAYIFSKALTSPYQVFAFEPEQRNLEILKRVAKVYQFSDSMQITAAALGDKEGEIELWQNDGHHADHRVLTDELRKQLKGNVFQVQKTPLITVDGFLKKQNCVSPISFIKIDVQGYELPVCKGMEKTLLSNPNCVVEFEYCPSIMEALGYCAEELIQFFEDRDYLFYRLNNNGKLDLLDLKKNKEINHRKGILEYFDIICTKKPIIMSA